MKKTLTLIFTALLCFFIISGCQKSDNTNGTVYNPPVSSTSFMFDTVTNITIYSAKTEDNPEEILKDVTKICNDLENKLSKTIEESDVNRINKSKGEAVEVSDETAELINLSKKYSELSKGAFDITIAPLSEVWNFQNKNPTPPSDDEINTLLTSVGMDFINIDGNTVTKTNPDTEIDLGGIAKGYIADRIKEYLTQSGVESAMIDLGGNILTVGGRPDQTPFVIGIQRPFADRNELCATIEVRDWSVVSSGIYERCFPDPVTGEFYHHILNPSTGYSYQNNLIQVTILSKSSAVGDALSTSCFALGLDKGLDLINSLDDVYAIFITDDYQLHYSDRLTEQFTIREITE